MTVVETIDTGGDAAASELSAGEAPGQRVHSATVVEAKSLSEHVRELTLQPEGDTFIAFTPGQWLSLRLPVGDHPPLVRAYSLANAPRADGSVTLTFDRVAGGLGSEYLWNVPVGTGLSFTGPVGNFILPPGDAPLVMVARFTGVVPFRAMIQCLKMGCSTARPVRLIHGASDETELVYRDELTALAAEHDWFTYHPLLAADSEVEYLAAHAADWMPFVPMVCGVREFTFPTRAFFIDTLGFERKQVKVENYNGPSGR